MRPVIFAGLLLASAAQSATSGADQRIALVLAADASLRADPVWPGFGLTDQPLALELDGKHSVLIGHPAPPPGFKREPGPGVAVATGGGALPDFKFEWDTDYPIGGAHAFAYRFRQDGDVPEDLDTLVHERFHVFQKTGFQTELQSYEYPDAGPDNLALAGLEQRALAKALAAGTPADRAAAGRMFVAIRRIRNDRWGLAIRRIEDWEEQSEGTAEYVTKMLFARPSFQRSGRAAGAEAIAVRLDRMPGPTDLGKHRSYGVGAAIGMLLDREGVTGWQASMAAGNPPAELAARAFPVLPAETDSFLRVARIAFGYTELLKEATVTFRQLTATRDRIVAQYQADPGIEFRLTVPTAGYSARFAAIGPAYALPDGARLQPAVRELVIDEPGFSLTVRERPVASVPNGGGYRFKIPPDTRLIEDGHPAAFSRGTHEFKTLAMNATGFEFSTSVAGSLVVTDRSASVTWSSHH